VTKDLREIPPLPRNILHNLAWETRFYGAATASNGSMPEEVRDWSWTATSRKEARGHLFTLSPVGIPRSVGLVNDKSPPKHSRRVHYHERGRPWYGCEGVHPPMPYQGVGGPIVVRVRESRVQGEGG
jgi:hypothetical protein